MQELQRLNTLRTFSLTLVLLACAVFGMALAIEHWVPYLISSILSFAGSVMLILVGKKIEALENRPNSQKGTQ